MADDGLRIEVLDLTRTAVPSKEAERRKVIIEHEFRILIIPKGFGITRKLVNEVFKDYF